MCWKCILFSWFCISAMLTYCGAEEGPLQFKIPALEDQTIPALYTCDGTNISPALFWSGKPSGTKSYAIICLDKDATNGTEGSSFIHWLIYNINPKLNHFSEGLARDSRLTYRGFQGRNSFHRIGYDGPCPPPNIVHHYVFTLYALDAELDLRAGATYQELDRAMNGHVLAQVAIEATYKSGRTINKEMPIALNRPDMLLEEDESSVAYK